MIQLSKTLARPAVWIIGTASARFAEFVGDLETAVAKAKEVAGNKWVTVVGGASTARQCIKLGLADEVHVGIMPVLFGDGLRLFEDMGDEPVRLETIQVLKSPGRTDIKYRVVR